MKTLPSILFAAVALAFLLMSLASCEKEDLDWNRQKISFVQVEVDPIPIETTKEVILGATIVDIEDENLEPKPQEVRQFGHLYSTNRTELEALSDMDIDSLSALSNFDVLRAEGRGLAPRDPSNPGEQSYITIIITDNLEKSASYFFMAYVVRPSDGKVKFSEVASQDFKIPLLEIETIVPEDAEIEGEMKVRARGKITEANDVVIIEYGHRLLDENCEEVIDSSVQLTNDSESFTGELEYVSEFPFFEVNTGYCIQAYVKFQQAGESDTLTAFDNNLGDDEKFRSTMTGFWINTEKIRKKSGNSVEPPKLEHAVSFVLTGADGREYAYVGLGKEATGEYNNKFWRFDPRFYLWEEVETPFPEEGRIHAAYFTKTAGMQEYVYIGMGFREQESGDTLFFTDLYRADVSLSEWEKVLIPQDFANAVKEKYQGSQVMNIEVDQVFTHRIGTFSFSTAQNDAFWGGGRGPAYIRNTTATIGCALGNPDDRCDINHWNDFDNDNRIDWGEWVDINNDGVINAGVDVEDGSGNVIGIDIDLDGNPEVSDINSSGFFIRINSVEVTVVSTTGGSELYDMDYGINPELRRSEWNDMNFDKIVNALEIRRQSTVFSDLWRINDSDDWEAIQEYDEAYERYGGLGFSIGTNAYLIGGENSIPDFAGIYRLDDSGIGPTSLDVLERMQSLFGVYFIIGDVVYFGGGEDSEGNLRGLNLKEFNTSIPDVKDAIGCGPSSLSGGVGFASENKGFIGLGRVGDDEITNEVWMYIPR